MFKTIHTFIKDQVALWRADTNRQKKSTYFGIFVLELLMLAFLVDQKTHVGQNVFASFISPLPAFHIFSDHNGKTSPIREVFSFVPGWTETKFDLVNLQGVNIVSFYDIPVHADGTLYRDVDGYQVFRGDKAAEFFARAHQKGAKVLLTISQTDPGTIQEILNDPSAQQTFIQEAVTEITDTGIDGITIDFEFAGTNGDHYKNKFTSFVKKVTDAMHQQVPNSTVAVAIAGGTLDTTFYDIPTLEKQSDRLFVMAYDFAVPETRANQAVSPLYGYGPKDYWQAVSGNVQTILTKVPVEKLALETAWYGNGDNYPMYTSDNRDTTQTENTLSTPLSNGTIERLVSEIPAKSRAAARINLPLIAKALENEHILNSNVLAYALATIEHETAETFQPIDEFKGRKSARRLGYEGGTNYYGRGFIQLTHLRNYQKVGARIGMGDQLVKNPELASKPEIAARVLAAFFKDNGIARLATNGSFVAARRPINPDYQGYAIAYLAYKFLDMLG